MEQSDLTSWLVDLTRGEDERREVAAHELASHGTAAISAMRHLFASPDPDLRWWAIRVLAEIDDPQVIPLLCAALHDPDNAVRQCAALALRKQPHRLATSDLIAALGDKDRMFAHLAGDALVAIGQEAVPALLETLQNGSQAARLEAVRALARIGDPRAIPALFTALDEESALMEYWADQGLDRMGVGMAFFKP